MAPALTTPLPLRLGTANEFLGVRKFFIDASYDDATLCRLLNLRDMSDVGKVNWEKAPLAEANPPLRWCIDVFLRCSPCAETAARTICGEETLGALISLGLLRRARQDASMLLCPVWLYPADGFLMVSDRRDDPDGGTYVPPEDVVFPAIYAGTLRFLRLLPASRGEALDLCGGSGIGALHLAKAASGAATADVTERSAFFAEFNARLNQAAIASLCGDLYAPVAQRQFDLISAHPPFVPATGQNMVYRDGGDTGEEITRRTVEGLPAHLRAGGTAVILCVARDTVEGPFEQRVSQWLGAAKAEFDIVFGFEKVLSVDEVVDSIRKRGQQISEADAQQLKTRLQTLGTKQFVYGALMMRRLASPPAQTPLRVQMTPAATAADFEKLLAWRARCRMPGFEAWLAESRPRLAPQLELNARHLVQDGQLVPAEFVFVIEGGFQAALRPDAWIVPIIARLDGRISMREIFEAARTAGDLPDGFAFENFSGLVQTMIGKRMLEVDLPDEIT